MFSRFVTCLVLSIAFIVLGCGETSTPQSPPTSSGSQAKARVPAKESTPAGDVGVVIEEIDLGGGNKTVLEAESGEIVEPMKVYEDSKPPAGVDGPRGASGQKYVETAEPTEIDPATNEKKKLIGGSTNLKFSLAGDGKYYVWLRVWWRNSCANKFSVSLDGDTTNEDVVTDNTNEKWHWVAVGESIFNPAPFELKQGDHTLQVTSREDGSVLDQVLIVDDPDYRPQGIEKAEE